jgi:hypothetical protein
MIEGPPTPESPELDPNTLSFRQLEQAYALARTTFTETENGFRSVNGDVITIREIKGVFRIESFPAQDRQELHRAIIENSNAFLRIGSPNRKEMMNGIRDLLKKTGNRIIE